MKKVFYLLFTAVIAAGLAACGDDDPKPRGGGEPTPEPDPEPQSSVYEYKATDFWCGYYGDYIGDGTAFYTIELSEGEIDEEGYLTSYGNAITLALTADLPKAGEEITLPLGTYKTGGQEGSTFNIVTNYYGYVVSFYEFWDEGDESSFFDFVKNGTLTVKNLGYGNYSVVAELDLYYLDEDNNEVDDGSVKCTYNGPITVENYAEPKPLYDVIDWDVQLNDMNKAVGTFYVFTQSQLSNYYLTLFDAPIDWDKDEYTGTGYAMTIDLFTDYTKGIDFNQLNATFNYAEPGAYEEWHFNGGSVSEVAGEPYWDGTYIDEIAEMEDEQGKYYDYGRSAMVTGGKIVAQSDGTTVTFDLDLTTEAGKTIKGKYTGTPEVTDKGTLDAIKARMGAKKMMRPFSRYAGKARKSAKMGKVGRKIALDAAKRTATPSQR